MPMAKPASLIDTRVIYCGDDLLRVYKADKRIIKLITVQEILDEQHVQKM